MFQISGDGNQVECNWRDFYKICGIYWDGVFQDI